MFRGYAINKFIVKKWNAGWSTSIIADELAVEFNYHVQPASVKQIVHKLRKAGWEVVERKSGWNMKQDNITRTKWEGTRNKKEKFNDN